MEQGDASKARGEAGRRTALPVTHSVLAAGALAHETARLYELSGPVDAILLSRWLSDVYLVRAGGERFALKVDHAGRRGPEEIIYELDLVRHASRGGVRMSLPVARRDGGLVTIFEAPEGPRHAVLFTYAPGRPPRIDATTAAAYGRFAGALHRALDDVGRGHPRGDLDARHLLVQPIDALGPFLAERPDDLAYLRDVAGRLARSVDERAAAGLAWGLCHGDLNGGNVHVDAWGAMTGFDLDRAAMGWRAYDLAVFRWATLPNADADATWAAFLDGYRSVCPIDPRDLEAVPLFVACRAVWFAGLLASRGTDLGAGWLLDWHLDDLLSSLRLHDAKG